MEHRPLPLGIDDFEKLRTNNLYYVDKTLLIKELLDNPSEVSLFTRPRRFGKSLNMSMLRYFFEAGRDSTPLFQGLKIMDSGEKYLAHRNRYPVIMLSLKSLDQNTFDASFRLLKEELSYEFARHRYLLESDQIDDAARVNYQAILSEEASFEKVASSLRFLSQCLYKHYAEKAIILIDEYDVPLEKAYFNGYYDEMIGFMRSFLNIALKSNTALAFSVLTGCLRISKESIFTGLNNLRIETILSVKYGEYFGFTRQEVQAGLKEYQLENKAETIARWYNGYLFGNEIVYNPWSVIQYIYDTKDNENHFPVPYWSNTSSNSIVRTLIEHAGPREKEEIEKLIQGDSITVAIHEDITYEDVMSSSENLWNFLFFTGYLKKHALEMIGDAQYLELTIPNQEVRLIYKRKIEEWMRDTLLSQKHTKLYESMLLGDVESFQQALTICLKRSISYMDAQESYYHGFLTGILDNMGEFQVRSNRESGSGRGDIFVTSYYDKKIAVIIEVKVASSYQMLKRQSELALEQIEQKKYAEELHQNGYFNILKYGIAFYKKDCEVKLWLI